MIIAFQSSLSKIDFLKPLLENWHAPISSLSQEWKTLLLLEPQIYVKEWFEAKFEFVSSDIPSKIYSDFMFNVSIDKKNS